MFGGLFRKQSELMKARFVCRFKALFLILVIQGIVWTANVAQAQSLFGNRGATSQTSSALRPTSPSFGSPSSTAALTPTSPGGFIGRGNASDRFVGVQQSGTQRAPSTSRRQEPLRTTSEQTSTASEQTGTSAGRQRQRVRARERVAFSFSAVEPSAIDAAISKQFAHLASRHAFFTSIRTETGKDGQVVVRGEVASLDQKKLAEFIVRLQPGVRSIQNDINVVDDAVDLPSP